jgi:F like protein
MGASQGAEDSVRVAAESGLRRFLGRARDLVMQPFERFRATPNPDAVYAAKPVWMSDVDRIMNALTPALQEGWAAAHLPGVFRPDDPYIQANLALTRNLLVGIPDEVHALVIREILAGSNAGQNNAANAARVSDVLDYSGSENWPNRAAVIAQTESNRHYNSSLLAHGLLVQQQDGGVYMKEWQTLTDGREREAHRIADHQVQLLHIPFMVGGEPLQFPCAPDGRANNVINCRCGMTLKRVD